MHGVFRASDLLLSDDVWPVECIGGPNDGEFRPANENGLRPNGMYVVVNNAHNVVVARRYVPASPPDSTSEGR